MASDTNFRVWLDFVFNFIGISNSFQCQFLFAEPVTTPLPPRLEIIQPRQIPIEQSRHLPYYLTSNTHKLDRRPSSGTRSQVGNRRYKQATVPRNSNGGRSGAYVPPLVFSPKGRHTRLRFIGSTQNTEPGVGGRIVIPSFDPTSPAFDAGLSSNGRLRNDYTATVKLPNHWQSGDKLSASLKSRNRRMNGALASLVPTWKLGPENTRSRTMNLTLFGVSDFTNVTIFLYMEIHVIIFI